MAIDITELNWQEFPLLMNMSEADARRFLSMGFSFRYEAGASIVSNNDQGETFFMLLKGMAKLLLLNNQREAENVTLFRAGDFFGEMAMLEPDTVRNGNIAALTDVEVAAFHKKDFLKMMHDCPTLSFNLARTLTHRLRFMNQRLQTSSFPDELHRVAHTLVLLASKGKSFSQDGPVLLPPLSLREWSLFCYTSGESFMAGIEKLKQTGLIEWQNQRIVVNNLAGLQALSVEYQERLARNATQ